MLAIPNKKAAFAHQTNARVCKEQSAIALHHQVQHFEDPKQTQILPGAVLLSWSELLGTPVSRWFHANTADVGSICSGFVQKAVGVGWMVQVWPMVGGVLRHVCQCMEWLGELESLTNLLTQNACFKLLLAL